MHLLAFGINFLPHTVNLILIIIFLTLLNLILLAHVSHHHTVTFRPTLFHSKLKRYFR